MRMSAKGRYVVKLEPADYQGYTDVLNVRQGDFDPQLERDNMAQSVDAYRPIKNFPSPENLCLCRRRLKISLKQMVIKLRKTPKDGV